MKQDNSASSHDQATAHKVAIIGAGLTGLTAAIRLAEHGLDVHIFEASSKAGGRTRSFYEKKVNCLCDNGPHLLVGAYQATRKLLNDCGISHHVTWQTSLLLPLWDKQRGAFDFKPSTWLPIQLALLKAVKALPGHNISSTFAMIRLALSLKSEMRDSFTVKEWMIQLSVPQKLIADLIEPLCLGAMNESIDTANARSFRRVLHESFANHQQARLGWFNRPLDQALIQPLCAKAEKLGVTMHTHSLIRSLNVDQNNGHNIIIQGQIFESAMIALPAYASDRLLGQESSCETRGICNIHLWFDQNFDFPTPFIGGLGTTGQWFFDVSSQIFDDSERQQPGQKKWRHICAVISADQSSLDDHTLVQIIRDEVRDITSHHTLTPVHHRIIREKRATVLVRSKNAAKNTPQTLIDASEHPIPGQLPATIESAVQRGEKAAVSCLDMFKTQCYPPL